MDNDSRMWKMEILWRFWCFFMLIGSHFISVTYYFVEWKLIKLIFAIWISTVCSINHKRKSLNRETRTYNDSPPSFLFISPFTGTRKSTELENCTQHVTSSLIHRSSTFDTLHCSWLDFWGGETRTKVNQIVWVDISVFSWNGMKKRKWRNAPN